jgi:hypothetical protein
MWTEFLQSFRPSDNRAWADRRYWANVTWLGVPPPPPGTSVQIHDFDRQPRVLAADGAPLGTLQAFLNPARIGLARAQVSQDVSRIDISYLGPDDLSANAAA